MSRPKTTDSARVEDTAGQTAGAAPKKAATKKAAAANSQAAETAAPAPMAAAKTASPAAAASKPAAAPAGAPNDGWIGPRSYPAVNPATGEKFGDVPCTNMADMPRIFERARAAQRVWEETPFDVRKHHILKVRDYMVEHMDQIAETIALSNGKTRYDALNTEVIPGIMACDWYGKKAKGLLRKRYIHPGSILFSNKRSYVAHIPRGVIGVISPWNYPFSIPFGEIIMALMAGNAVVYKTSEETPMVGMEVERCLAAGNLPEGLATFIMGDGPMISNALFANRVDKIFFTGSVRVGKILMKQAAETLTPLSLELGGNDPMVVLEDANIERAANGAIWAGFQNSGQSCGGVERIYVHESRYDEFVEVLSKKTIALRQGVDRGAFDVDIGSMAVPRQLEVVRRHVEDAVNRGATIAAQTTIMEHEAPSFYPCTVLTNVNHDMLVMKEETFGPVVGVMPFKTEEEAIRLANDSDLGLTGSVWTTDYSRGRKLCQRIHTGVTTINDHLYTHGMSELPWTGWKESGIGVTHGAMGLEEMTKPKLVNWDLAGLINTELWWFPVRKIKYDALKDTMEVLFGKSLWIKFRALMRLKPRILADPHLVEKVRYAFRRFGSETAKITLPGAKKRD